MAIAYIRKQKNTKGNTFNPLIISNRKKNNF